MFDWNLWFKSAIESFGFMILIVSIISIGYSLATLILWFDQRLWIKGNSPYKGHSSYIKDTTKEQKIFRFLVGFIIVWFLATINLVAFELFPVWYGE